MSPTERDDAAAGAPAPTVRVALHATEDVDEKTLALFTAAVRPDGLQLVTQITSGTEDLMIDLLDRPELARRCAAEGGADELRDACSSVARLVTGFTITEEERLAEAHTGRLIRVVLHSDGGAVFCYSVVPRQYVVGFTFVPGTTDPGPAPPLPEVPAVAGSDAAMADLVTELRAMLKLPTQNPAGLAPHERPEPRPAGRPTVEGRADPAVQDRVVAATSPADLHYVARLRTRDQDTEIVVDHFADRAVRLPHGLGSPEARRKLYTALARELFHTTGHLSRLVRSTVGGALRRMVLDVEQGAVYYYRVDVGDYLVGVSLYQTEVDTADHELARLAADLAAGTLGA